MTKIPKISATKDNLRVSRFRRFMSQLIASSAGFMLLFNSGISSMIPGILIPAMTGIPNQHNHDESLELTPDQASWLGSVLLISALFGCILSSFTTDVFGRKRSMILANVPFTIAWITLCGAEDVYELFIANILLGLGSGLMESPVVAYVGEICEPEFRSLLVTVAYAGSTFGSLFVSVLNTLMSWRMAASICTLVPMLTNIILCFIPDSPAWLLSKHQSSDAKNALTWLRGWVSPIVICNEFEALQRYSNRSKACNLADKLCEFKRKKTIKPLIIVITLICMLQFSRFITVRSFIVQIFYAYDSPIAPDQASAILHFINIIANMTFLSIIYFVGKRRLYLFMLMIIFFASSVICVYGFLIFPKGYNSFNTSKKISLSNHYYAYIPFVCMLLASFCSFCAVNSMPSQMLSELFSLKIRGTVTGLMATLSYLLNFFITNMYYNLEISLSLPGVTLIPTIIIGFGFILLYRILPETSHRSLEDIELHYSDNSKKITDRKIPKNLPISENIV